MVFTGIDLVENERIRKSVQNDRFVERVYGEEERREFQNKKDPVQNMAASFAGKEAFLKAIGTGLGGCALNEIQILHKPSGQPYLSLSGKAEKIAKQMNTEFSVSLTHTKDYAAAVVVGEVKK